MSNSNQLIIYLEGSLLCAVMLVMLFMLNRKNLPASERKKALLSFYAVIIAELFLDHFWFMIIGKEEFVFLHWLLEILYICLYPFLAYFWLLFVGSWSQRTKALAQKLSRFYIIPVVPAVLITLAAPINHGVFYVDQNGNYYRGPLIAVPIVVTAVGLFMVGGLSVIQLLKEDVDKNKKIIILNILFPVLPIVFSLWQLIWLPSLSIIYYVIMLALYILYNFMVINDELEGLSINNADDVLIINELKANSHVELVMLAMNQIFMYNYYVGGEDTFTSSTYPIAIAYMAVYTILLILSFLINNFTSLKHYRIRKYMLTATSIYALVGFIFTQSDFVFISLPILLAIVSRYYNKRFFTQMAIVIPAVTLGFFWIATLFLGVIELNLLALPAGSQIVTGERAMWVDDAIYASGVITREVLSDYLSLTTQSILMFYVAILVIFYGIVWSGRSMLSQTMDVEREKALIESEFSIASDIQKSMLPSPELDGGIMNALDIAGSMNAAREVGGDFYDYFLLGEDKLCLVIGDVSGKGIPAALFMARSMTCLRDLAEVGMPPDQILSKCNDTLCERNDNMLFVTIWLGILNINTGELQYGVAGHNPPLIKMGNGDYSYLDEDEELVDLVIAAMPGTEYHCRSVQLEKGDRLILYTDGVTEAVNENEEFYGTDRFREAMNADTSATAADTVEYIRKELHRFSGNAPQFDDITLLSIIYGASR